MSYSKSIAGNKLALIAAVAAFAVEQKTVDESYPAGQGVVDGHQAQIAASESILKRALEDPSIPDSIELYAGLSGHAGSDGKGTLSVSIGGIPVSVPVAAEPPTPTPVADAAAEPSAPVADGAPPAPVAAE